MVGTDLGWIDVRKIRLPDGEAIPCLGQGTWNMGEQPDRRSEEIEALRAGVDLGMSLIDTAEMYADGATEELVGEGIASIREQVFLVSKAYPQNASRTRLAKACEASLRRLGTDRLDLYLLHWRGGVPLAETVEAMQALQRSGKIRHWGVSNLDTDDMVELVEAGGGACVTDQILYNLTRRGPERDLLPWLERSGISAMAYSPVEQGRLIDGPKLAGIAADAGLTPSQLALAWVLRQPNMIAIPKAGKVAHVRENRRAADAILAPEILARVDAAFPAPRGRVDLQTL
jgi:diketogulonate reductase-like aldo/keto reductase